MEPTSSVIICHHAGSLILRCLDSLWKAQGNFEVILITSMKSFNYAHSNLTIVYEDGGPDHKRNVGAKIARGKYLVFLDDDVEIREDCIVNFGRFMDCMPDVGMAFAKILNMERRKEFDDCGSFLTWSGFLFARAQNNQEDFGQYDYPCRILASKSATCIIRRNLFDILKGFDESFYILGEETDLAWRVWLQGHEVWYTPNAVSWHAFGTSLKPPASYYTLSRIHYLGCKNYLTLLTTHLPWERGVFIIPGQIAVWIVAATGFCLRGQFRRGFYILAGIAAWSKGLNKTLRKIVYLKMSKKISGRSFLPLVTHNPPLRYYTDRLFRYLSQGLHG